MEPKFSYQYQKLYQQTIDFFALLNDVKSISSNELRQISTAYPAANYLINGYNYVLYFDDYFIQDYSASIYKFELVHQKYNPVKGKIEVISSELLLTIHISHHSRSGFFAFRFMEHSDWNDTLDLEDFFSLLITYTRQRSPIK